MNKLNEVATLAASLHATPNKADCLYVVNNIIINGEYPPSPEQLAVLYAHFQPTNTAKPKNTASWLNTAVGGKNEVRGFLKYTYTKDGKLTGCDGHRLHQAPTTLDDGYYDKSGNKIDDQGTYPDINRVIPDTSGLHPLTPTLLAALQAKDYSGLDHKLAGKHPITFLRNELNSDDASKRTAPLAVNTKYLKAALANPSPLVSVLSGSATDSRTSIRLDFKDGSLAVIMPIRT